MIFEMKLQNIPFSQIKEGSKTIELRLYDEKRKKLQIGDYIKFSNVLTAEILLTKVKNIILAESFPVLFSKISNNKSMGFSEDASEAEMVSAMERYYSKEDQDKYGVIGIEIEVINDMHKHYTKNDLISLADESTDQVRKILQERCDVLERMRDAINDRYPFDDLFLKWFKIDYEKSLIQNILKYIEQCSQY